MIDEMIDETSVEMIGESGERVFPALPYAFSGSTTSPLPSIATR